MERLLREVSRLVVRKQIRLTWVYRTVRAEAGLRAMREWGSMTLASRVLGVSRTTLRGLKRGMADPEGVMDGRVRR